MPAFKIKRSGGLIFFATDKSWDEFVTSAEKTSKSLLYFELQDFSFDNFFI